MNALLITIRNRWQTKMERRSGQSRGNKWLAVVLPVVAILVLGFSTVARSEEGIAVAIVYDTSGSMNESVSIGAGKYAPKYVIANKALGSITDRISQFAKGSSSDAPRKIEAGLFIFQGTSAKEAVKFGAFDAAKMRAWVKSFSKPEGATPLGNSIKMASQAVLNSKLSRKHVVVVTDGANTSGPKPEQVVPEIKMQADKSAASISFHFVAFDVDAKVFEPVKKLGATVLGASDEKQLNNQLDFIFQKKILLEDEEPAKPK